ncbi:MAG: 16S rRNA (guanine(527)-N(7))-methyltransferase RsmG [Pseudomonadota bacterium]
MGEEDAAHHAIAKRVDPATLQTLETFVGLCKSWGAKTNLVSSADKERLWSRHVADSLQLVGAAHGLGGHWIDLGAGAGFPGLVVAIARPETTMTLVESNKKKAAFLLRVAAECKVALRVESRRAEALPPKAFDVVSARALAPLHKLLALSEPFFGDTTVGLFPKGREAATELTMAHQSYRFDVDITPSRTDPDGVILRVRNLVRA